MTSILLTAVALLLGFWAINQNGSTLVQRLKPRERLVEKVSVKKKFNEMQVLLEVPDFAALLWFAVSAGQPLDAAMRIALSRSRGFIASEFATVLARVDLGAILQHELENLAVESKSDQVRELATKLAVALVHGSSMADQLSEFTTSATAQMKAKLLEQAGKAETKMMIPLVFVILPVTVMFALYPSLAIIQNSFI